MLGCPLAFHLDWQSVLIVVLPKSIENVLEGVVFLLDLLVMAAALVSGSSPNECCHGLEFLVKPAHLSVEEVTLVFEEEEEIESFFLESPVANIHPL